jgi:hypothetical protein
MECWDGNGADRRPRLGIGVKRLALQRPRRSTALRTDGGRGSASSLPTTADVAAPQRGPTDGMRTGATRRKSMSKRKSRGAERQSGDESPHSINGVAGGGYGRRARQSR